MTEFTAEQMTEFFEYLDSLRASGVTNMYGARPYVVAEFDIDDGSAGGVLKAWMRTFEHGKTPDVRAAEALATKP